MSFVIIITLGLCLTYLFERKMFLKSNIVELCVMSVGIGVALLTIIALYIYIVV